jgi:replicative DNA helicase
MYLRNEYNDLGGLRTGIEALDKHTREVMGPGRVVVVAGESGRGKTALMGQMAVAFAAQTPTMLINLEDESTDSAKRWLANVSRENVGRIRSGFAGVDGIPKSVLDAANELSELGLDVIDGEPLTVEGIARQIWQWKKDRGFQHGGAVIIDQLSHIVPTDPSNRDYFVQRELPPPPTGNARADKTPEWQIWFLGEIAKRLGVLIVIAHQLNNAHAIDTKPSIRSVRDSQGIVHKADLILIPWRPKTVANPFAGPGQPKEIPAPDDYAMLLGVKARQIGEFEERVSWLGGQQRFSDLDREAYAYKAPEAPSERAQEGARRLAELRASWAEKKAAQIASSRVPALEATTGDDNGEN